jgi:hypothetical protein
VLMATARGYRLALGQAAKSTRLGAGWGLHVGPRCPSALVYTFDGC